jgi:hypothetical protein
MTTPKYVLVLPVAASLLVLPTAAQPQACGGGGPQGWWCGPPGCGGSGPQAPGCPQPPGVYYERRGFDRDGDEWRYRERRRYSRHRPTYGVDPCWQMSPYRTYVWVCR